MTRLSVIETEARRLAGRTPEVAQRALQAVLVERCEEYWRELRGPQPAAALAQTLWSVAPPLAELFVDLYTAGDARLAALLEGRAPARALAALVLAEIERGNAEGVRIAYEAMMLFELPAAARGYAQHIAAALRGRLPGPALRRHAAREPLWKALAAIVAHTGRHDLAAVIAVIRLLAAADGAPPEAALDRLRAAVTEAGVNFVGFDGQVLRFDAHGREHKPATRKHVADCLAEIRQARLH